MRHARALSAAAGLVALLAPALPALGWGPDGHRVTGEIAWRLLAPSTRDALLEILSEGRDGTLAEAAAWADTVGRRNPRYRWLEPLHFMNADPAARSIVEGRECQCVLGAIERARDRLRDPEASRADRLLALRQLAHFVGDIHQPLHVSHPDHHGGTTVDVFFDGRKTTLHRLWDGELLRRRLREMGRRRGARWRAFARSLADSTPPAQRVRWQATLDPRVWAEESLVLAREHTFSVREGARLGDAYYDEAMPVVAERLTQAGVRLAALLDASFAAIR